jgi:hypothetical protein
VPTQESKDSEHNPNIDYKNLPQANQKQQDIWQKWSHELASHHQNKFIQSKEPEDRKQALVYRPAEIRQASISHWERFRRNLFSADPSAGLKKE